ncbi:MAG: histidine decarboxylase, pyruvoyl type [Gaiellales bacterium]
MQVRTVLSLDEIVNGAVGPFDDYCDGYGNPGASGLGYVSVLKLSTGTVRKNLDSVLEGIVSYDRAEKNDAYAGQINMIAASSFNGLNGAVWGYDIARHDGLDDGSIEPILRRTRHDGAELPVYPVAPLLEAGERLFGSAEKRRFPLLPGSHVICATKEITVPGPTTVWSAIALAFAEHRDRDSSLFIEDVGQDPAGETHAERENTLHARMEHIVDSVILCGEDQDVLYREIFVGFKMEWVPEGYVGCALTCAPYVVLAKNAVPEPASALLEQSLSEWDLVH